jgi:hypothetical protein
MPAQPAHIPQSLDFANRSSLRVDEIAAKLSMSPQHVVNLIEDGTLPAMDLKGSGSTRPMWRVSIDDYRRFIAARMCS